MKYKYNIMIWVILLGGRAQKYHASKLLDQYIWTFRDVSKDLLIVWEDDIFTFLSLHVYPYDLKKFTKNTIVKTSHFLIVGFFFSVLRFG